MVQSAGSGSLLDTAVARLHDLVLADPRLAPLFEGVDLPRLRSHQADVLGAALDGSARVDLREAHAGLGIDDVAYDRLVAHLLGSLADIGVDQGHLDDVREAVAGLRDQVVET